MYIPQTSGAEPCLHTRPSNFCFFFFPFLLFSFRMSHIPQTAVRNLVCPTAPASCFFSFSPATCTSPGGSMEKKRDRGSSLARRRPIIFARPCVILKGGAVPCQGRLRKCVAWMESKGGHAVRYRLPQKAEKGKQKEREMEKKNFCLLHRRVRGSSSVLSERITVVATKGAS